MYGLPITRQFEMNDMYDLISVVENFDECPLHQKYILASNIKKAFNLFNVNKPIEILESNSISNFLNEDFVKVKEQVQIEKEKVNEFEIMDFKKDLMDEIYNLFGVTSGHTIIKESYEDFVCSQDKLDEFFIQNDTNSINRRLIDLKKHHKLDTKLDCIDILKLKKNLVNNNDSVYFPSTKTFMGDCVYINDALYLMSKKTDNVNEYMLIPLDSFWENKGMKIVIEDSQTTETIDSILKRLS